MEDKYSKRLKELKNAANDPSLNKLLEEMVNLEKDLDALSTVEKYRLNPEAKTPIKISPAFYAYHKTLSAYKECMKLIIKQTGEIEEESPLRSYLKGLKNRDSDSDYE